MQKENYYVKKQLNGDFLFSLLKGLFDKIPDWRKANSIKISISDALMSAFALFSVKDESLLQFIDRLKNDDVVEHNLKNIYNINVVPSDTRMREIIDEIDPSFIKDCFKDIFQPLQRGKVLNNFKFLGKFYLLLMDGTGYFSSDKVYCKNCLVKESKKLNTVSYSHSMLGAAIVHPDMKEVIPIAPEPIIKQDGHTKNDCERNAGKRLLAQIKKDHPRLPVIIVEDALASNMPHINELKKHDMRFILGVKPKGNKFLFNWVQEQAQKDNVTEFSIDDDKMVRRYRYVNNAPLNESNSEVKVNFFEYWEETPKGTKHFTWITDIEITKNNVKRLVKGGRARWKIENETFNTLKNQGYHFEHNFGHGNKNLSVNMALLMMLAFLVDQIQQMCCKLYQAAFEKETRKIRLLEKIKYLFNTLYFDSWTMLLQAIAFGYKITKVEILNDTS